MMNQILAAGATYMPSLILSSFDMVMYGVVAAYATLMIFIGKPGFFSRTAQTVIAVAVAYGIGRVVSIILQRTAEWGQPVRKGATPDEPGASQTEGKVQSGQEKISMD